jgi:hypothetical protein
VPSQTKETIMQKRALLRQRKDHAKEKAILQEIILEEIKYKKQKSGISSPSELQNNCLPHIITWFQFYNKLLEETTQRGEETKQDQFWLTRIQEDFEGLTTP